MKKKCNFCGNCNFTLKQVQYIYRHDGKFLVINNVPAEVCEYCGEQYFKAEDLKKIEDEFRDIYNSGKKTKQQVQVPVEEFMELR